jgi:hypothetical protein
MTTVPKGAITPNGESPSVADRAKVLQARLDRFSTEIGQARLDGKRNAGAVEGAISEPARLLGQLHESRAEVARLRVKLKRSEARLEQAQQEWWEGKCALDKAVIIYFALADRFEESLSGPP